MRYIRLVGALAAASFALTISGCQDDSTAPERVSAAGIGPDEGRFRAAVERVHPGLAQAA